MLQRNPDRRSDLRSVAIFLIPFSLAFLIPGLWLVHEAISNRVNWIQADAEGKGGTVVSYMRKGRRYYRAWIELAYRVQGRGGCCRASSPESAECCSPSDCGRSADRASRTAG
jgi:hypothetical protein